MNNTNVRPHAWRRHRSGAGLLLIGPTVAAAVLLGAAPQVTSMFGSPSPSATTDSGEQIELVHTSREWLPLKPRGETTDVETSEDVWERQSSIPRKTGFEISEGTIQSECKAANGGTYGTKTGPSGRVSTCAYTDVNRTPFTDYFVNGRYSHTVDRYGNIVPD